MNTDPIQPQAVDLAKVARDRELEKASTEKAAIAAAQLQAIAWDSAMTRAFKGIMPAPMRRRFLMEAADRA